MMQLIWVFVSLSATTLLTLVHSGMTVKLMTSSGQNSSKLLEIYPKRVPTAQRPIMTSNLGFLQLFRKDSYANLKDPDFGLGAKTNEVNDLENDFISRLRQAAWKERSLEDDGYVIFTEREKRIRRNVVVTSTSLNVSKSLTVYDTERNPDAFRVTLVGQVLAGDLFDVTVNESIQELEILNIVEPTDQTLISTQTNQIIFRAGNLSASGSLRLVYEATLSNLGSGVTSSHLITSAVEYFTNPSLSVSDSLSASVCVTKETSSTTTSCIWCIVLLVLACFILGFLVAFFVLVLLHCWSRPLLTIEPIRKKKKETQHLMKSSTRHDSDYDVTNMAEVLSKENETEMLNDVEVLKFRQLHTLQGEFEQKRKYLTKDLSVRISEENRQDYDFSDQYSPIYEEEKYKKRTFLEHNGVSKDPRKEASNFLEKHKEEIFEWQEKLGEFSLKFQEEMISLVKQRHTYDVIEAEHLKSLERTMTSLKEMSLDADRYSLQKINKEIMATDDSTQQVLKAESFLLDELLLVFSESIFKVHKSAARRNDVIIKITKDLAKEKKVWNKMASQQTEVLKIAKRQDMISNVQRQSMGEKFVSNLKARKVNFEKKVSDVRRDNIKNNDSSRLKINRGNKSFRDVGNDVRTNDVTEWIKLKVRKFREKLYDDQKLEEEMDDCAFQIYDSYLTVMSQTRNEVEKEEMKIKNELLAKGVDEHWLEDIYFRHKEELHSFTEELNQSREVTSSDERPLRAHCTVDDVSVDVLKKVESVQASISKSDAYLGLKGENKIKKLILQRTVHLALDQRLKALHAVAQKKRLALERVISGEETEEGIRRELKEKLQIASGEIKLDTKKFELRGKRHRTITSRRSGVIFVGHVLTSQLLKTTEMSSLMRERSAIEDLMTTFLQLLTSNGNMTSSECKSIMQEHRVQVEETKRTFAVERKRKEELLKRKSERNFRKSSDQYTTQNSSENNLEDNMWGLLDSSNDVIHTSSHASEIERRMHQELFETRREVGLHQERALMEQEMRLIRGLAKDSGANPSEMKQALQMLLPGKESSELEQICRILCPAPPGKKRAKKFKSFLPRIRQIVAERQKPDPSVERRDSRQYGENDKIFQHRKLSSLSSQVTSLPVVRPEPVGRTATPEKELDRYDRYYVTDY
ncbi:uncharacterized protein LOC143450487 isoform X1 [Clavelina lepadiformis]|uniref:uncharacterized protein LOC143450487 isoform X1 n=1 Tax=Clavelina lepadiformis TaxID=159417 RepID=UPI0040434B96